MKGRRRKALQHCKACGSEFQPWRSNSEYCTTSCANKTNGKAIKRAGEKTCKECRASKPKDSFSRPDKQNRATHSDVCDSCTPIVRARTRAARPWYHRKVTTMLNNCRLRAASFGLEFSLVREDIVIPETCPIFGVNFEEESKKPSTYFSSSYAPSIDRIDSSKGYTKGNFIVVSCRANSIKSDATVAELIAITNFYAALNEKRDRPNQMMRICERIGMYDRTKLNMDAPVR